MTREAPKKPGRTIPDLPYDEGPLVEDSLATDSPDLLVEGDIEAITGAADRIDLTRRRVARKIMRTLIEAYPAPVDVWDLFETTWPEVVVTDPSALNRLYTAIHRLRALGLEELLVRSEDGYKIASLTHAP